MLILRCIMMNDKYSMFECCNVKNCPKNTRDIDGTFYCDNPICHQTICKPSKKIFWIPLTYVEQRRIIARAKGVCNLLLLISFPSALTSYAFADHMSREGPKKFF